MVDNEQPPQPGPGNLPDLPEQPPAGVDPETFRQFQEFQRFQQFQRFNQATPPAAPPWTAEGGNLEPVAGPPGPGRPDVHEQLAGMRHQLTKIQHSQAKIERVTNPPLWRKILRSTPFRWAVGLLILILLAVWGVPALIHHYFGNSNQDASTGPGADPLPVPQRGVLPLGQHDAVAAIYLDVAKGDSKDICGVYLTPSAAGDFARAFNVETCADAVTLLSSQVTDKTAYAHPDLLSLPESSGSTVPISSCDFNVTGGPRLGIFTVTKQDQGWQVTAYQAQPTCPAPTTAPTPTF